jgi:mono/diheme cytochrome c family protein
VAAAGIEAKAKSEKLKGPDLGGVTERHERAWIEQYVRKQIEFNGAAHKKEFKGTDEELAALIDWLATFPCAEDSSAAGSSAAASASPVSDLPATVRADR